MDQKVKTFAINSLRRASYRWPGRYLAQKKSHVGRNAYLCNGCKSIFTRKEVQLDHIIPVVSAEGFTTFDSFIERLFCSEDNYQTLCITCHGKKSIAEGNVRRSTKKLKTKRKTKKRIS